MCRSILSVLLTCIATGHAVVGEDTVAVVGKPAPDFTATGIDGKEFTLAERLESGDRNTVLVFSRANWCPFCMGHLIQLQKHASTFDELNADVLVIFREERSGTDGLKKIKAKTKTTFTLALDLDKKSSSAYSSKKSAFDSYVIDRKGVVLTKIDGTKMRRATAEKLIEALRATSQQ